MSRGPQTASRELAAAFPGVAVHYAVKANPHPRLLACLHAAGCRFEAASWAEVRAVIRAGADPSTVLFTHPVKPAADIARAWKAGVWRFAADSDTELDKIARNAPGSAVLLRIDTGAGGTVGDQGKFGIPPGQAPGLARLARSLGLTPYGLAFHVGSQTMDPRAWDGPIRQAAQIMTALAADGIRLAMLDLGGGFPVRYDTDPPPLADYAAAICGAAARLPYPVQLACEPGRAIAAPAGTMTASVIGAAWRGGTLRVSLDTGAFHGLIEALESGRELRFPVTIPAAGNRTLVPCTLTGPSCDSQDTILDRVWLPMPLRRRPGADRQRRRVHHLLLRPQQLQRLPSPSRQDHEDRSVPALCKTSHCQSHNPVPHQVGKGPASRAARRPPAAPGGGRPMADEIFKAPAGFLVGTGEGAQVLIGGLAVQFKLRAAQTGGRLSITEMTLDPHRQLRASPPSAWQRNAGVWRVRLMPLPSGRGQLPARGRLPGQRSRGCQGKLQGLEDGAKLAEILAVGAPHGGGDQGGRQSGEPGWLAAVPQRHPGRPVAGGLPGIGGLHRERPLDRPHDQPLAGGEFGYLVGVSEVPAKEARSERHPGSGLQRRAGLPGDGCDVLVPGRGVRRLRGVGGDDAGGPADDDLGHHVHGHSCPPGSMSCPLGRAARAGR